MRLLLLRHAKAERPSEGGRDFDRPLAERGRADAAAVGAYLADQALAPDRVLVSSARRAEDTWQCVRTALGAAPQAETVAELYGAPAERILAAVRARGAQADTLLVVAHNPGLEDLARLLAGGPPEALPTAGLAVLEVPSGSWGDLAPGAARRTRLVGERPTPP